MISSLCSIAGRAAWCITPVVFALSVMNTAQAQVYKCKRDDVIAYQDQPCPKGTQLGRITLEAPPVVGKTPIGRRLRISRSAAKRGCKRESLGDRYVR